MKVCSLTLTGNNADIIGEAIRSAVGQVDLCVVVDTRVFVADGTLEVAGIAAGEKLRVFRKAWRDDFGYMRNAALDCASQLGCDWALWLDTDERLVAEPGAVRQLAEAAPPPVAAISCWHVSGEYAKERLIRIPRRGHYHGRTHEYLKLDDGAEMGRSEGAVKFDELDKDEARLREKLERDIGLLAAQRAEEPEEPRWCYYLGDAQELLGDKPAALQAFLDAFHMGRGGDMAVWSAWRAAVLQLTGGDAAGALQVAVHGMTYEPLAELMFAAGAACHDLGEFVSAKKWAMSCIAAGYYMGYGRAVGRGGRIHPPALYEAPFELLARCEEGEGNTEMAEQHRQEFAVALMAREAAGFKVKPVSP